MLSTLLVEKSKVLFRRDGKANGTFSVQVKAERGETKNTKETIKELQEEAKKVGQK